MEKWQQGKNMKVTIVILNNFFFFLYFSFSFDMCLHLNVFARVFFFFFCVVTSITIEFLLFCSIVNFRFYLLSTRSLFEQNERKKKTGIILNWYIKILFMLYFFLSPVLNQLKGAAGEKNQLTSFDAFLVTWFLWLFFTINFFFVVLFALFVFFFFSFFRLLSIEIAMQFFFNWHTVKKCSTLFDCTCWMGEVSKHHTAFDFGKDSETAKNDELSTKFIVDFLFFFLVLCQFLHVSSISMWTPVFSWICSKLFLVESICTIS